VARKRGRYGTQLPPSRRVCVPGCKGGAGAADRCRRRPTAAPLMPVQATARQPFSNCYNRVFPRTFAAVHATPGAVCLKRAALAASLALILAGCGGPSSTNNTQAQAPPSAALKQRAFITNQNAAGGLANGLIDVIDASVDRLVFVLTTGGTPSMIKVLAFNDVSRDTFHIIDISGKAATAVTNAALDFPIYGVFSSDDSKAYILSCGAECGGTTAKVSVLDVAAGTISQTVTVSAATTALLDGTRLYVAGTQ